MNTQEVQELITLTPLQIKAWRQLESAVRKCKKEKIYFYQVLEKLYGLNGINVRTVTEGVQDESNPFWLMDKDIPHIPTSCSWADDSHYVVLKKIGERSAGG